MERFRPTNSLAKQVNQFPDTCPKKLPVRQCIGTFFNKDLSRLKDAIIFESDFESSAVELGH